MRISNKLIRCISILLIIVLFTGVLITIFTRNTFAKEQNTKDYTKGSNMLDDYPGYSELLDSLLEKHPNWTFTILFTGLDWDTVIKNETTALHGRSLVQNKTGEWVCSVCGDKPYDNGSWRCASAATVSYYMDPRNSLFEDYVFQFENLKWVDGKYTIEGIKSILSGCSYLLTDKISYTNTSGKTSTINKSYAQVIMDAAKAAGISPYHLASRIRQEQGTGSQASATANGKYSGYVGYYNFLNVNASGSGSANIIRNALNYAKKQGWNDPEKSIRGGAEFLAESYIQYGQNTLYLQKYDVDDSDGNLYWHQYQQNVSAAKTESQSIKKSYQEIDNSLNMPFNFVIPVFENMPGTRSSMPGMQSIVTQNIEITAPSIIAYEDRTTKSAKLATLKDGDKLLRIEIGRENINGHKWDKIVLNDGRKAYVTTSGYELIDDITNCDITAIAVEPGNVRNGPGTSGTTILTTLTVGQRVTIIEKGKYNNVDGYDWSRIVMSDGTQGYIVARYLEETVDGSTETGEDIVKVVCNGGLTIRKEPGTNKSILGYADKGDYLTRIEQNVSNANSYIWDKIVTDSGVTGYVARGDDDENYIEPINGGGSSNTTEPATEFKTEEDELICEPDTEVSNILAKDSKAVIKNAKGEKVTSGNIGTGYTIEYNGKTYTAIKLGDVNGDGNINSGDTLALKQHVAKIKSITNENYSEAADVNKDGVINSGDSLIAKQHVAKIKNINL